MCFGSNQIEMIDEQQTKKFGAYLEQTLRVVRRDMMKRLKEAKVDITPEQWIILHSLYQQNGQSQTDLANGSFKDAPTVSRIIDLLCKKEFTERRRFDNDRRRYKIFLTEKGKTNVEKALPSVLESRQKGWDGLNDEDYTHFLRIMNRIFENFSE